jgi:hypothetical protein
MLDRSGVRELLSAAGLDDDAETILAAVRPGWRLELDRDGDPARPACSKIGGDPDLVPGEKWPVSTRGARMVFLAQVDCSQLPALPTCWPAADPWPHEGGLIRVFANLLWARGAPCAARALSAHSPSSELVRTAAPIIELPLAREAPYDGEELVADLGRLPECVVRPTPFLTVPEVLPGVVDRYSNYWERSERASRYRSFATQLRLDSCPAVGSRHGSQVHHLLGDASSIQDDVREMPAILVEDLEAADHWEITPHPTLGTPDAWRVFLALHFDERIKLYLGDGGALHVMVPVADLLENRMDRLVCDFSEG